MLFQKFASRPINRSVVFLTLPFKCRVLDILVTVSLSISIVCIGRHGRPKRLEPMFSFEKDVNFVPFEVEFNH